MIARRAVLAALFTAALAIPAFAQSYPNKPIHLIVPYPAGGGTDFFARLVGQKMQELIGQPVVVENKPGAATNLGADFVAKAQPDGYTILLGDVATFAANQSLYKKIPFDAEKDFAPITLTARFVSVLLVNPNKLKVNSVAELIAAAKAEPGKIDVAHAGVGNPFHLAAVLFQQAAGIKLNEIPYRGAAPAVQDLLGGTVPIMFVDYATARSHIASGSLKALGVAALEERKELPGVPPVAATAGLAGFEAWPWQGLVAPAKTPPDIIAKLRDTYVAAVADPVVRQKLDRCRHRSAAEHAAGILRVSPQGSRQVGRGDQEGEHPARLIVVSRAVGARPLSLPLRAARRAMASSRPASPASTSSASVTVTPTITHAPSPQAMPSAAVTHTVAAVVRPVTSLRWESRRITPAPMKLMPAMIPWITPCTTRLSASG